MCTDSFKTSQQNSISVCLLTLVQHTYPHSTVLLMYVTVCVYGSVVDLTPIAPYRKFDICMRHCSAQASPECRIMRPSCELKFVNVL